MEFNPKLINPVSDVEIYADVCPTIGTLMLAHYSTPAKHNPAVYKRDEQFFSTFPDRRLYLRPAIAGEFDVFKGWEAFKKLPVLWVLVSKLTEGTHEITPRYRGERFWKNHGTDDQTAAILIEIAEKGALKLSDWYSYVADERISNRDERKKAN